MLSSGAELAEPFSPGQFNALQDAPRQEPILESYLLACY